MSEFISSVSGVAIFENFAERDEVLTLPFTIEADYPGGNIVVTSIEDHLVRLAPDNTGNKSPWFYWNFAVRGAAGRTLEFEFEPRFLGVRGPAVSLDAGQTWQWMGADSMKTGRFSYCFPEKNEEVRFSVGMPYVAAHFKRFLDKYESNPNITVGRLTQTPKGRDVTCVSIKAPGTTPRYTLALTSRHHASEMMGNYVLEGILDIALTENAAGKWLRGNVEIFAIPFMDTDGVEDGDQGKNRDPHDHNRDYADNAIYTEVAALKKRLPEWSAGRPLVFIDIHDPALKGDVHESLVFLEAEDRTQATHLESLLAILSQEQQITILIRPNSIMKFGAHYNDIREMPAPHSAGWAQALPNSLLGVTLEIPYANAGGCEVNASSARAFGRDLAVALKEFFLGQSTCEKS